MKIALLTDLSANFCTIGFSILSLAEECCKRGLFCYLTVIMAVVEYVLVAVV